MCQEAERNYFESQLIILDTLVKVLNSVSTLSQSWTCVSGCLVGGRVCLCVCVGGVLNMCWVD